MQHKVNNEKLQVTCNVKLLENLQASKAIFLSGNGCCTVALSKYLNGFITPEGLVIRGSSTILVVDNANESGTKMFSIPISGGKMISFLDTQNRIVVLAVGKSNIQLAISKSSFSLGHELVFEKHADVFKTGIVNEIVDVKYRRIPLDKGGYVDKILVVDKNKKVYTLEYDHVKSSFGNRKEIRRMEKVMDDNGLWAFWISIIGEMSEYTPADFLFYSNNSNYSYNASDSIVTVDENHYDKNYLGFEHVNCIEPYGSYNRKKYQSENLLYAAKSKDKPHHRIYIQDSGITTHVDDVISNNPDADIYDIVALPANDRDVSFICAIGNENDTHNVLYTGVISNDYYEYVHTGMVREMAPIYSGVSSVFPCQASDGILTGFIILDDGTLVRFIYSLSDDSIITRPVEIDVNDNEKKIHTFNCYHTQLDLATTDGTPISSGIITITSPYTCLFEIMGKRYAVKENHPLEITDIVSPTLYITQYADEIYASEFNVKFRTKDIEGKEISISCTINPSAENEEKISSMTSDDWCKAKKQDGNLLIPTRYNCPQNMDALEAAISKITKATSCPTIKVEDTVSARRLMADNVTEFALIFEGDQIRYRENNIHQLYISLRAGCRDGSQIMGIFGWAKKKLSSVIKAASKKIVEITHVVVAKVENAFHTIVKFVKDGVEYIIEEVLDFVSKAYDTITAIFSRISVCFQDFMQWLGKLLNWDEIKQNTAMMRDNFFKAFGIWQSVICDGIQYVGNGIESLWDYLSKSLDKIDDRWGNYTLFDIVSGKNTTQIKSISQEICEATSNNIFMEKLLYYNSQGYTQIEQQILGTDLKKIIDDIIQLFRKYSGVMSASVGKLFNTINGYDNILSVPLNVFVDFIRGLLSTSAMITKDLLDIITKAIGLLFDTIKTTLEKVIDIPLFSWIFRSMFGMECNIINIISLIVAFPYSIVESIFMRDNKVRQNRLQPSSLSDKELAVGGICIMVYQKMVDTLCSFTGSLGLNNKYVTYGNGVFSLASDSFTIASWFFLLFEKIKEDDNGFARFFMVIGGGSSFLFDFTEAYIIPNIRIPIDISNIISSFSGLFNILTGISAFVVYQYLSDDEEYKNPKNWYKDNPMWDSASVIASGVGSCVSIGFNREVAESTDGVSVAIAGSIKIYANFVAIGASCVSCLLTFNPDIFKKLFN